MPAPSAPVAGSTAQGTGLSINIDLPAGISADDIIVVWYTCMNAANPATAFTWPAEFTEGEAAQLYDEAGAHIGLAGWAWKRSVDGSESSTQVTLTRNGSGGGSSSSMANSFRISGCETSGNPYNVSEVNNPNPSSSTGAFPPITTLVADTLIVSGILKSGAPGNYGTPTDWTVISSNSGTGGTDSGADWDYRQVASTGTYTPTGPTIVNYDSDTGWAAFQIAFIEPQGGGGTPQHLDAAGDDLELTAAADLTVEKNLVAAGAAELTAAADLTAEKHLVAAADVALSADANLTVTRSLLAAAEIPFTAAGALTVWKHLAAEGAAAFTGTARLTVGVALAIQRLRTLLRVGT